eukprot:31126-Pelagococcus_subviridis.AAC.1
MTRVSPRARRETSGTFQKCRHFGFFRARHVSDFSSDDVLHPSVRAPTPPRHVTARATMNAIASSTTTLRVAAPGGA